MSAPVNGRLVVPEATGADGAAVWAAAADDGPVTGATAVGVGPLDSPATTGGTTHPGSVIDPVTHGASAARATLGAIINVATITPVPINRLAFRIFIVGILG